MGGLASTNLICLSNANSVTIHDYLLKNNSLTDVPTNQQYDYHEFSWGSIEIVANNATNCFIVVQNNNFEIYANGSISVDMKGIDNKTVLKTIVFDDYPEIPIAGNEYKEIIDDKNFTTGCTLTIEGGSVSSVSGVFHIVTLFNNEIDIYSNEGVQETTWLSKVSQRQALGDDNVYRVFFTRGDFWFTWPEPKEMIQLELFAGDENYNIENTTPIWTVSNASTGISPKRVISSSLFETHYILQITNSVGDIQNCLICAQNLNLNTPTNPFKNFWFSWNGETNPIMDYDGGTLWAKLKAAQPDKYTDDYLQQLDDITINKLILLSTNWPIPDISPNKITIVDGYSTSISTVSGYSKIAALPFVCQIQPIGADISVSYNIYYHETTNIAPNFLYVNVGGYLCIKPNTWEVYPSGQIFDVVAISNKNQLISVNKAEVTITITGNPAPKIKNIILTDTPINELYVDPRDGFIATAPVSATVNSVTGEIISQDVAFKLSSSVKIPEWITIDQDGFLKINQIDTVDDYTITLKIIATSTYNDAYSVASDEFTVYVSKYDIKPKPINFAGIIIAIIVGLLLISTSGIFWLWHYKNRNKVSKTEQEFVNKFAVSKKELQQIRKSKSNTPIKNAAVIETSSKNIFKKIWMWITAKDITSKGSKDGK
ncbi:MAG: hypothetical protein LBP70_00695 [Mycoplasmataceae bacterium]|nr:hypothetical protein [Mycoplasmataceae bacterium]